MKTRIYGRIPCLGNIISLSMKIYVMPCNYCWFWSTAIIQTRMVCSSLNVQYYRTGIGALPFLGEIGLRQSIREELLVISYGRACKNYDYFFWNSKKLECIQTKSWQINEIRASNECRSCLYAYLDEMWIVWYIVSIYLVHGVIGATPYNISLLSS
jgi:hypothetical protein